MGLAQHFDTPGQIALAAPEGGAEQREQGRVTALDFGHSIG